MLLVTNEQMRALDASVGAKWLKREHGSEEARALLLDHGEGRVRIVVPIIFVHEIIDVARRRYGVARARELWHRLREDDITVVGIDDPLIEAMLDVCAEVGCTFYDAAAPALARRLGAPFVSADRRAHGDLEDVEIIG